MGACLSSGGESIASSSSSSALVVLPNGDLRPYRTPVLVSDVLETDSSFSSNSFFVCNSDSLAYDEHIKPLEAQDELDAGQIYFVLPVSKLRHRLGASEMAALAVKASVALNSKAMSSRSNAKKNSINNNNRSKVAPFVVMESSKINVIVDEEAQNMRVFEKQQQGSSSFGVSRSGSIRKMQRYSSRKTRLAVRSFKLRLSTIYESDSSHKYRE